MGVEHFPSDDPQNHLRSKERPEMLDFTSVQDIKEKSKRNYFVTIPIDVPPLPDGAHYVCGNHFYYRNSGVAPLVFESPYEQDTALIDCGNGYLVDVTGWEKNGDGIYYVRVVKNENWDRDSFLDQKEFDLLEEAAAYAVELARKYVDKDALNA